MPGSTDHVLVLAIAVVQSFSRGLPGLAVRLSGPAVCLLGLATCHPGLAAKTLSSSSKVGRRHWVWPLSYLAHLKR